MSELVNVIAHDSVTSSTKAEVYVVGVRLSTRLCEQIVELSC